MLIFIGTYTHVASRGLYAFRFDLDQGTVSAPWLAAPANNLTFLALDPSRRHVYATGELRLDPPANPPQAGISAFAIDAAAGRLNFLNQQPTGGKSTTHVAVDATGRMVLAVNYGDGYTCAAPIEADGRVGARSAFLAHHGPPGPNLERQNVPHAHSVTLSPDNRFAAVCDLGLDRVLVYRLDPIHAALTPNDPAFATAPAGSGPRHSKFSADGRFLYVATEMGATVCVYACDTARGALILQQTISTLPADFTGAKSVAEIRLHPNGRYVYVSNRGHDSLAVFRRDPAQGGLELIEIVPSGGQHPRNFALSPDGRWLLCANRDSNNVVVFKLDPATGRLTRTGVEATVPEAVCVLFAEPPV